MNLKLGQKIKDYEYTHGRKCLVCNKKIKNKNKSNLCIKHLSILFVRKKELSCEECGKKLYRSPSNINKHNLCSKKCYGMWQSKNRTGKKSARYVHGLTSLITKVRGSRKSINWSKEIKKRDKVCQICGNDKKLEAHHIKSFKEIWIENNIKSLAQSRECKELWNLKNGITVCNICHYKITHSKQNKKPDSPQKRLRSY